ncbi:hypothetical protein [Streptomyces sp. NBC_00076]|uniref:hypothetical protein n=1 Tax=Streptomyces sp. NBC_00076 TaxID=2975642 RepID=UPI00324F070E
MSQDADEYNRDERIETIYQGWGAREMAERIVDLEDELGEEVDGICTGMHADVAEAWSEIERLRLSLADCDRARESAGNLYLMFRDLRDEEADRADRYRSAWLSARRRAADEANFGMEALELKEREVARWRSGHETAEAQLEWRRRETARLRAELDDVRKTFDAPRLEPLDDGEGGQVWRLVGSTSDGADVYMAPAGTPAPKVR